MVSCCSSKRFDNYTHTRSFDQLPSFNIFDYRESPNIDTTALFYIAHQDCLISYDLCFCFLSVTFTCLSDNSGWVKQSLLAIVLFSFVPSVSSRLLCTKGLLIWLDKVLKCFFGLMKSLTFEVNVDDAWKLNPRINVF